MTRWYVEHNETWWVEAESDLEAQQLCRDGGGEGHTVEWFAEEGTLVLSPPVEVPRD
jgi:hypothetical protein